MPTFFESLLGGNGSNDENIASSGGSRLVEQGSEFFEQLGEDTVKFAEDTVKFAQKTIQARLARSALAGKFLPFLNKFFLTPDKLQTILQSIEKVVDWQDLALLLFLGWATVPLLRVPYEGLPFIGSSATKLPPTKKPFDETINYQLAATLSQVSKIALLIYTVDMIRVILLGMGFEDSHLDDMPVAFAKIAYAAWAGLRISKAKKTFLSRTRAGARDEVGRVQIFNRLLDAVILGVVGTYLVDILSVELGLAMKSIFAFGSIGTLVVSLASQGLAAQVLNGLMLSASDRIHEGDVVKFGNGLNGRVEKLGWMETVLRGTDEITVSVPNTDLASQTVSNLSRVKRCQVQQSLEFAYEDIEKLEACLDDIKANIKESCGESLILDGSRPFHASWTGMEGGKLSVEIDSHFWIKPIGKRYHTNRQNVLRAIHKAVAKHSMTFA